MAQATAADVLVERLQDWGVVTGRLGVCLATSGPGGLHLLNGLYDAKLGQRGPYIDYMKTIHIAAPVEDVFAFWQSFENFPKFMRNVRSVRKNTENNWHWEVAGPLGSTVRWDAEMTVCIPNELIAWTTTPGSQVEHAGLVHFQREGDGTRIQVEMGYNPPGAVLGHVVASLFGADPLTEMDEDLMRLKGFLETGKPARDAAQAAPAPA